MKKTYNKSNVYTFEMCVEICNNSDHCTILPVENGDFRDYQRWLEGFYKKQATVGIKLLEQQIFSCTIDNSINNNINLSVRQSSLEEDLPTTTSIGNRRTTLLPLLPTATSKFPVVIPSEGIPPFKQCQLYKNYRCLIPIEYQDITCPKPSMEILTMEEEDKKRRKTAKKLKVELETQAKNKKRMWT